MAEEGRLHFFRNCSGKQGEGRYKDGKAARLDVASVLHDDHGSMET